MEFFTGLSLKHWFFVFLAFVAFSGAAYFEYLRHEVKVDKAVIATQHVQIKSQADTIKTDETVKKLGEATQVAVATDVKVVEKKHEAVRDKLAIKEREIEVRFDTQPVSVENLQAEQLQLSTARIDGLWEAYCATEPNATECTTPSNGAPHA